MKAEIKTVDGKQVLVMEMVIDGLSPSKSGKSQIVCSTHGVVRTDAEFAGQKVSVNINAFIGNSK